ncbi:hypothetical protein [Companilactobacillus hulinensis]|uniref:hypothetical protein n=1 Tax=Companilactobacillus hulinensis TaxID=2486007 RepID=UPI00177C32C4|nr:hypothetical protein [Companilactobacillus hulinensis]
MKIEINKLYKKVACSSLVALSLLGAGAVGITGALSNPANVEAQSVDYKADPDGIYNMGIYVNIDGRQKLVYTEDLVWAKNVGDIDTVNAPLVDGHIASPSKISFQKTATGFKLLQVPTYTKSSGDPSVAAKNATTKTFYENVTVKNKNGSFCPLVAFSKTTGEISDVKNRGLSNNTKWYSDKIKTYDGAKYYRVATNEWVKDTYYAGAESGGNIGPQ